MKKGLLLVCASVLLLTGCSSITRVQEETAHEAQATAFRRFLDDLEDVLNEKKLEAKEKELKEKEKTEKEKADKEAKANNSENSSSSDSSSNNAAASQATEDKSQYPYMVSFSDFVGVGRFTNTGMNIPNNIDLAFLTEESGAVSMSSNVPGGNIVIYTASYHQIPTKSIRIFSAGSHEIRTVNVNSEIVLEYQTSAYGNLDQGNLYVFTNSSGGLSLATPNYAGNVPDDQMDVMLEYLP